MEIVKGGKENSDNTIKYDPSKRYTWTPEDKFEMTGEQFGRVLNAFRAVLSTPEAQKILIVNSANECIEDILANAVESGIVKEQLNKE